MIIYLILVVFFMNFLEIALFFTILGAISSGIGGMLSSIIKIRSNTIVAGLYEITSGIMTGIVCFDMLPESFSMAPIFYSIFGTVCGILMVCFINYLVEKNDKKYNSKTFPFKMKPKSKISNTALVVMISMGLHNAIEGLAIGSGFSYSYSLGISILISMFLHDIPEGMVVGITNIKDTDNKMKVIVNAVLVGACVGIGCVVGLVVGNIDDKYIAFCLSIAAGAMLCIVSCDLLVMSKRLTSNKLPSIMYIIGILFTAMIN